MEQTIHGTCVAFGNDAALIRGDSGSGKSDLAYRFISLADPNCYLVSDDRVYLTAKEGNLIAHGPDNIKGLIELRGVGLIEVPYIDNANLQIVVDLVDFESVPRMQVPFEKSCLENLEGHILPHVKLHSFEPSAPLKLLSLIKQSAKRF
ncbi:MAG: HPr kinase/phosphorylase [Methyloligellaceae bacterium]